MTTPTGPYVLFVTTRHKTTARVQDPPLYSASVIGVDGKVFKEIAAPNVSDAAVNNVCVDWVNALQLPMYHRIDVREELVTHGELGRVGQ